MSFIEIKNVTKKYKNGVVALDNVNVNIEKGEFVFIIGGKKLYDNDIEHLKKFFGAYRTLKVRPRENVKEAVEKLASQLSSFDVSITSDDTWISILVNEEQVRIMKVLEAVQEVINVRDMQLEEISTEDVIKKIYEGGTGIEK